jgi:5'-3' exonuclease
MTKYIVIDTANSYFRARHTVSRQADISERLGFAIHTTLASVQKVWRDQAADHAVFCLEGRSWRKDHYAPYKRNRSEARAALNVREAEEDRAFWENYDQLTAFIRDKTNCTVLQHPRLEADDLIAGWIQNHPDDQHVIVSTDTDYYQLLADNVSIYNGVNRELITVNGVVNDRGRTVIDKKTNAPKTAPDPAWALFEKCMRGDSSDNVFSAYPGVRTRGTKNKPGLQEAFADRHSRGYNWNNLVLQRWVDHEGVEHRVLDDYQRNVTLVDLSAQPAEIRQLIDETVGAAAPRQSPMIGTEFLRFCGRHDLVKISEQAAYYVDIFTKALV